MANKLKTKKQELPNPEELVNDKEVEVSVEEVVKDERTKKIAATSLLLLCVFIFLSIISYCFTWQQDQSLVQQFGMSLLNNSEIKCQNIFGSLGAFTAHQLVFNGFGISSLLLCVLFFVFGVNMLFSKKFFSPTRNIKYVVFGLLLFSTCLAFVFSKAAFSYGGAFGNFVSSWLVKVVGSVGTSLLLLSVFFVYFIWRFNPTFTLPEKSVKPKPIVEEEKDVMANNATSVRTGENDFLEEELDLQYNDGSFEGNKLKSDVGTPTLNINLPKEKDLDFEVIEKEVEQEEISQEQNEQTINDLYANKPVLEDALTQTVFDDVPPVKSAKIVKATTDDFALEINPIVEDEVVEMVQDFVPTKEETALEKNSGSIETTYDPALDLSHYIHPTTDLLETHGSEKIIQDPAELETNKNQIIATLRNYDIEIQKIAATVGPTVTLYEIVPAPGVRISRIKNLEDDIALSLAALGIRIIAPIPGKGTIGIEVPNIKKTVVSMKTLLQSDKFQHNNFSLPIAIGKKIDNENFIVDLATMPHLLMAGATGQGKSVGINTLLVSLLYKKHPSQLKLVLVDPKKVELSLYKCIENHFLAKLPGEEESIITDTKKVVYTLNALCIEMDNRYDLLKEAGCRNIREYNEKFVARKLNPQKGHQYLPFIVLIVDEFADLIMTAGKEVEMPIARLAQLARAIGIHLIIATQRPSVNIITGTIKANFPARIAFKVSSKIDSRTILDAGGAEQLIGKGDMLISYNGEITRLQCAFVDTPEVDKVCEFIAHQQGYPQPFYLPEFVDDKELEKGGGLDESDRDVLFEDAARLIVQNQLGSTSLIQRRMKLGYNRAGRLMDQLERAGIVGPNLGSKPREVRFKTEVELNEYLANA
jgi:S-DNA-T family DNA segregation ATPase FtsK/SpoIIIE